MMTVTETAAVIAGFAIMANPHARPQWIASSTSQHARFL
jgi:hypothetical protein